MERLTVSVNVFKQSAAFPSSGEASLWMNPSILSICNATSWRCLSNRARLSIPAITTRDDRRQFLLGQSESNPLPSSFLRSPTGSSISNMESVTVASWTDLWCVGRYVYWGSDDTVDWVYSLRAWQDLCGLRGDSSMSVCLTSDVAQSWETELTVLDCFPQSRSARC